MVGNNKIVARCYHIVSCAWEDLTLDDLLAMQPMKRMKPIEIEVGGKRCLQLITRTDEWIAIPFPGEEA